MSDWTFERAINHLEQYEAIHRDLLRTYSNIYQVIVTRRNPPISDWKTDSKHPEPYDSQNMEKIYHDLKMILIKAVRFSSATLLVVRENVQNLRELSYTNSEIKAEKVNAIKNFINDVSNMAELDKKTFQFGLKKVFELEIERLSSIFGYSRFFMENHSMNENVDYVDKIRIQILNQSCTAWLTMSSLLITHEINSLPLDYFLDTTDALYIFFYQAYLDTQDIKDKNAMDFKSSAEKILENGFPGSPKLESEGLLENGQFSLKKGTSKPFLIAQKMYTQRYSYFTEDVYKRLILKCTRDITEQVLRLYNDTRRFLIHIFRWFFGGGRLKTTSTLKSKIKHALSGHLGLNFYKCLELLKRTIKLVAQMQPRCLDAVVLQTHCVTTVDELFSDLSGFQTNFYDSVNDSIFKSITDYYETNLSMANLGYSNFAVLAAKIMSQLGYGFQDLPIDISNDIINLFVAHTLFIHLTETTIEETQADQRKFVLYPDYDSANKAFELTEQCILNSLEHLHLRSGIAVDFQLVFMSLPASRNVREIAFSQSKVLSAEGWSPNLGKVIKSEPIKEVVQSLSEELTEGQIIYPGEDNFLSDTQFRQLLKVEQNYIAMLMA